MCCSFTIRQEEQFLEGRYGLTEETRIAMQGPELEERLQFTRDFWPTDNVEWRLNEDDNTPLDEVKHYTVLFYSSPDNNQDVENRKTKISCIGYLNSGCLSI